MTSLLTPLHAPFFTNALLGGLLAALICAIAGTWVVIRGMSFLGEALSHGMLPGVAISALIGLPPLLGAAISALAMAFIIGWLSKGSRLGDDTSIGVTFVLMLSLGVIIVSYSASFATDLTAILFGDILAITPSELIPLGIALLVTILVTYLLRRPLIALAFDASLAHTLRMRPNLARIALTLLVTLALVASYRAVGTLLVVALLIAPAATAAQWSRSILHMMCLAALFGASSVVIGLYASWYLATAAGASIAFTSAFIFLISTLSSRSIITRKAPA
ncbi:zinc ABC transporter permease AztB [Schaalia suimastitidis]|uniref:zinc ABC transporter permease AztB n=1 Tax=Schaalia suimastitidis TaxID=121163 RepID=UPI00047A0253|nr:zinc ABC transporter permease AztB [Schaalia suimastitidis]